MRYPTLSTATVQRLSAELVEGQTPDVLAEVQWKEEGDELDLGSIETLAEDLAEKLEEFEASDERRDRDLFEGRAGARLHEALDGVPVVVLDDPGLWRFLSLHPFWSLVRWREARTFEKSWAEYRKYVDGQNPAECVLMRMYLRGQLTEKEGEYLLADAIPTGTDFWRSHVLRVRTGTSPVLTKAFAAAQADERMVTGDLRAYAKRLNRMWTNVVLNLYDEGEAAQLIDELRGS